MLDDAVLATGIQASPQVATALYARLTIFLFPFLLALDADLDRRLVQTFVATLDAILRWRNRPHGLLLSELGGYLSSPSHAPAGTKRLSNLLRSPRWSAGLIAHFLWQQADARLAALEAAGEDALVVWDDSVLEKPESLALEGLGAVRSSKAHRLTHIKPGYFDPPPKPIFVPGMQWIGVLLLGMSGPPTVAATRWWTSRGIGASEERIEQGKLFAQCVAAWGRRVLHVWDRGYAGKPWLLSALTAQVRFVIRWTASYKLVDAMGRERKPSEISRSVRSWDHRGRGQSGDAREPHRHEQRLLCGHAPDREAGHRLVHRHGALRGWQARRALGANGPTGHDAAARGHPDPRAASVRRAAFCQESEEEDRWASGFSLC